LRALEPLICGRTSPRWSRPEWQWTRKTKSRPSRSRLVSKRRAAKQSWGAAGCSSGEVIW